MTAIITVCRECGVEFEPTREAIVRGSWTVCPTCQAKPTVGETTSCQDCGRVLRGTTRTICLNCLSGGLVV